MMSGRKSRLRLATAALSNNIYAGYPTRDGKGLREPRHDVTSDAVKAIIEHVGVGKSKVITIDGNPTYEISITEYTKATGEAQ